MEYPPREDKKWQVTVYDLNHKPLMVQKKMTKAEAEKFAEQQIARVDVGAVEGKEVEEKPWL